jgi:hypothetical protein
LPPPIFLRLVLFLDPCCAERHPTTQRTGSSYDAVGDVTYEI